MALDADHLNPGGLIAGFTAYPRKEGETIAWAWLLLLTLWVMLFGVFGVAPVITRTSEVMPLLRNGVGFLAGGIAAYLIARPPLAGNFRTTRRLRNVEKRECPQSRVAHSMRDPVQGPEGE